jgi:hypothetical protein
MRRLILAFILLVFGVTHASATPYSLCRHVNAEGHAVALVSADNQVAIEAHGEEASAAAAKTLASLADKVAASAATGILPNQSEILIDFKTTASKWAESSLYTPVGRTLTPLLQPPSA